jgi:uncharacterized membrane protein
MEHIFPRANRSQSMNSRVWCGIAGGVLVLFGASKKSLVGGILSVIGTDLMVSGITGHHLSSLAGLALPISKAAVIPHQLGIQVRRSICIGVSPEHAYAFVRDFHNMPKFMKHIESVTVLDDARSNWVASGPGNTKVRWKSRIINEIPNELIAWRSEHDADIENAGSIWFEKAPKNLGTVVRVTLQFLPPGGALATFIARFFGADPEKQVDGDLKQLKQLLETCEITTTEGQSAGGRRGKRAASQREETTKCAAEPAKGSSRAEPASLRRSAAAG